MKQQSPALIMALAICGTCAVIVLCLSGVLISSTVYAAHIEDELQLLHTPGLPAIERERLLTDKHDYEQALQAKPRAFFFKVAGYPKIDLRDSAFN